MKSLTDVLRAEAHKNDLQMESDGLHVMAMAQDGSLYEIGWICSLALYQDPHYAKEMIEMIKFSGARYVRKKAQSPQGGEVEG